MKEWLLCWGVRGNFSWENLLSGERHLSLEWGAFLVIPREEEVNQAAKVGECHDENYSDDFFRGVEAVVEKTMEDGPNPDGYEAQGE